MWDARTGEKIAESPILKSAPRLRFLNRYKQSIVGLSLFTTERAIVVWDWQRRLTPELHPVELSADVLHVEVDQKKDQISIAMDSRLLKFDLANANKRWELPTHADWVNGSASIRDGRWIATAGGDGRVLVWSGYKPNQPTYELLGHGGAVYAVYSLRDGQVLVSLGMDGSVRWWDMDLSRVERFDRHTDWIWNADMSGSWLATAGRDGAYIVDLADPTREPVAKLDGYVLDARFDPADLHRFFTLTQYANKLQTWRWENDGSVREGTHFVIPPLGSDINYLVSFDISRDGKTVAGGDNLGNIHLWDAKTGRLLPHQTLQGPGGPARDVAFDPSGQFLAAVGQQGVHLWRLGTGKPPTLGLLRDATTVAFDPGGEQLVSGAQGGKLRIWSRDGQDLRDPYTFTAHAPTVGRPSFSGDGRLLAVGTGEGFIQVWDVGSRGTVWLTRQHGDFVNDVLFLPGDRPHLLSTSDDTTVALSPCEACQDPDGFAKRVASSPR